MDTSCYTERGSENDASFRRLEAVVERRTGESDARFERRLVTLQQEIEASLADMRNTQFEQTASVRREIADAHFDLLKWTFACCALTIMVIMVLHLR